MNSDLLPSLDDVRRISALDDPVVRNLQITQCYHELACELARWLPDGANWCAVATWASRQAGQSIRREDLRRTLERLLRESAEAEEAARAMALEGAAIRGETTESLAGAVAAVREALSPAAAFDRASDAVARGNQKVFAEIGFEFARFLALFRDGPPDETALAGFCDGLRPGDPPEGQVYLRRAFTHYHRALHAADDRERAEWMLLANLEIGFHEQTRLQPEILEAMNAPVYDPAALRRRLLEELFPNPRSMARLTLARLGGRARGLFAARDRLATETQRLGRLAVTELMMTLELSGGRLLRLGRDLTGDYPPLLRHVANPDLRGLLGRVDPTADSLAGTGSRDWGSLPDRMHFIADLFRAYHGDASLFDTPFTAAQVGDIRAGRRPPGI